MKKSIFLICLYFLSTTAIAADKVVVVPLSSSNTPTTAGFSGGGQVFTLGDTAAVVRSVMINAPSSGTIIVNASGSALFGGPTSDRAVGSITTGSSLDISYEIGINDYGAVASVYQSFASTRGYSVAPGTHTYNLVIRKYAGAITITDTSLTAIFIPDSPATATASANQSSSPDTNSECNLESTCP